MKNKTSIITILLLLLAAAMPAKAQLYSSNDINYHSFRSPMATTLNPAAFPPNSKFYVTLPRLDFGLSLPLGLRDVISHDPEKGGVIRIDSIMYKLTDNDNLRARLGLNLQFDLIGFGFNVKDMYFNFASSLRWNTTFTLPLNILGFLTHGNMSDYGREGNITNIDFGTDNLLRTQMYMRNSIGFAMKVKKIPLTVGGSLNLLTGLQMLSVDNLNLNIITDTANDRITLASKFSGYAGGIIPLNNISSSSITEGMDMGNIMATIKEFMPKSMGFTFDLGARYEWKDFVFSASIIDLGPGIHWTQNPVHAEASGSVDFEGLNLNRIITDGGVDTAYTNSLVDSLTALLDTSVAHNKYWYGVPTKVNLGASYTLNNMLRAGALFHSEFEPSKDGRVIFRQNTSLSVHFNLYEWLELAVANSFTFDGKRPDFFSPAASISFNIGRVFQLYLTLDYLSDLRLVKAKAAHIYFGANIVGYSKPKKPQISSYGDADIEVE